MLHLELLESGFLVTWIEFKESSKVYLKYLFSIKDDFAATPLPLGLVTEHLRQALS